MLIFSSNRKVTHLVYPIVLSKLWDEWFVDWRRIWEESAHSPRNALSIHPFSAYRFNYWVILSFVCWYSMLSLYWINLAKVHNFLLEDLNLQACYNLEKQDIGYASIWSIICQNIINATYKPTRIFMLDSVASKSEIWKCGISQWVGQSGSRGLNFFETLLRSKFMVSVMHPASRAPCRKSWNHREDMNLVQKSWFFILVKGCDALLARPETLSFPPLSYLFPWWSWEIIMISSNPVGILHPVPKWGWRRSEIVRIFSSTIFRNKIFDSDSSTLYSFIW